MCYLIGGKATYITEIKIKEFWNNYWRLPLSLSGDCWLTVVEVVVFIFSPSIFPSLLSPRVHSDIFHLSLFPLTSLMSFWVRWLLPHAPNSLKQCCSDQKPRYHLQAAGNAEISSTTVHSIPESWVVGGHIKTGEALLSRACVLTHTHRTISLLTHWSN